MNDLINRRTSKPNNFEIINGNRFRTRLNISEKLRIFFPSNGASKAEYKSNLIENYNIPYEDAISLHYKKISEFRGQIKEAQSLYDLIKQDGHETISPRLIRRYKKMLGKLSFKDLEGEKEKHISFVEKWHNHRLKIIERELGNHLVFSDEDVLNELTFDEEDLLTQLKSAPEIRLPILHKHADAILSENGYYVRTSDYSSLSYKDIIKLVYQCLIDQANMSLEILRGERAAESSYYKAKKHNLYIEEHAPNKSDESWQGFTVRYYSEAEEAGKSQSGLNRLKSVIHIATEVFGPDKKLANISVQNANECLSVLKAIPKNIKAKKKYLGMTLTDIVDLAKSEGDPARSETTISHDISMLNSIFEKAVQHQLIKKNPLIVPKFSSNKTKKDKANQPYSLDDVNAVLMSPWFEGFSTKKFATNLSKKNTRRRDECWLILTALFTGGRRNELIYLLPRDIIKDDDCCIINVEPNDSRSLKTNNSTREIPIHPILEELGLIKFAKLQIERGEQFLFSGLHIGPEDVADAFSKRYSTLLGQLSLKNDRTLTFHSYRSFVAKSIKDQESDLNINMSLRSLGWAGKEDNGLGMLNHYAGDYDRKPLYDNFKKISFAGIEYSHLINSCN